MIINKESRISLGTSENNRIINIIRIIFGIVCVAVAVFWLIFNIQLLKSDIMLWITIIFLSGFGFYQIWSGMGRAIVFIEISADYILLKKNPVLPSVEMRASDIEKIELFPMNVIFFFKSKKRNLLRFGSTYHETNEKVSEKIIDFAESNKIPLEIIQEKI
jgi:hypothetical protein